MSFESFGSSRTKLLVGGLALVAFVFLCTYFYTRPVMAPTTETIATTTEQEAASGNEVVEDFEVEPDNPLMALDVKPWKWLSATYVDKDVVTPVKTEEFSIRFNASGAFSAETDCNSISGSYEARNGALSLGSIASTKMFCEDSQEGEFTELLSKVVTYRFVDNGHLVMTTSDGTEIKFR